MKKRNHSSWPEYVNMWIESFYSTKQFKSTKQGNTHILQNNTIINKSSTHPLLIRFLSILFQNNKWRFDSIHIGFNSIQFLYNLSRLKPPISYPFNSLLILFSFPAFSFPAFSFYFNPYFSYLLLKVLVGYELDWMTLLTMV